MEKIVLITEVSCSGGSYLADYVVNNQQEIDYEFSKQERK